MRRVLAGVGGALIFALIVGGIGLEGGATTWPSVLWQTPLMLLGMAAALGIFLGMVLLIGIAAGMDR